MSRDQNAGWSYDIKIGNSSFERVEESNHLGNISTKQNSIQEEIKIRLKSENACYHSVQNLLFSSLLSKTVKIKIYRTIILPAVLRSVFRLKRDEVTWEWRKLHIEKLNDLYCSPNIIRVNQSRGLRREGHVARMGRGEVHTEFWWRYLSEKAIFKTQV
jgi:hypothetical protein